MTKSVMTESEINAAIRDELGIEPDAPQSWMVQRDAWFPISADKKARVNMLTDEKTNNSYSEIEFADLDEGEVEERPPLVEANEAAKKASDETLEGAKKIKHDEALEAAAEKASSADDVAAATDVSGGSDNGTAGAQADADANAAANTAGGVDAAGQS